MSIQLYAKPVVDSLMPELEARCHALKEKGINPKLVVFLVGNHPASMAYVGHKKKLCEKIGASFELVGLPETVSASEFTSLVAKYNHDPLVHGCFIQLPVPAQIKALDLNSMIDPAKDVDGFHPLNAYSILEGSKIGQGMISCTPKGVLTLLDYYKIPVAGKHVVIIGRSMIVGKPLALLLTARDATVTIAHSKTKNLELLAKSADIVVTAVGKAEGFGKNFFSPGQVVIDVGMNRTNDRLVGDVHFSEASAIVEAITPVPGGVGPMTVVSLIQNLIQAAEKAEVCR